jgi:hypothetical protein
VPQETITMPLFALVEGVRGVLVARPNPGPPVSGGFPRYLGLRFVARDAHDEVDARKAVEMFEPFAELVQVERGDLMRIKTCSANGEVKLLGSCTAPNLEAARKQLMADVKKPASPGKGDKS